MLSDRTRAEAPAPNTSLATTGRRQPPSPALAPAIGETPGLALRLEPPRRPWLARAVAGVMLLLLGVYSGYVLLVASDQYVVEVRFAVRSADTARLPSIPGMAGLSGTTTDSYAVVNFLRSPDATQELGTMLNLPGMFAAPSIDWFARLPAGASAERLHRYLAHRIRPNYDHTSGIVAVELRAFTAADALALAQATETLAEELVNRMSLRARRGLLSATEIDVTAAEQRLAETRDELRAFRERNQMIDPRRSAEAENTLRARLQSEIASLNAQLQSTLRFSAETSPQVVNLRNRIDSLEQESRNVQARAASADPAALSAALRSFETLETNTMVAQRAYEALLTTLERARGDASRQQLYLAHIVRPTLPGEALLPRRAENIATAAALLAVAALLLLLVLRTVREHVY